MMMTMHSFGTTTLLLVMLLFGHFVCHAFVAPAVDVSCRVSFVASTRATRQGRASWIPSTTTTRTRRRRSRTRCLQAVAANSTLLHQPSSSSSSSSAWRPSSTTAASSNTRGRNWVPSVPPPTTKTTTPCFTTANTPTPKSPTPSADTTTTTSTNALRQDFAARYRHYVSDWRDGCNVQAASTSSFLLFACLAPAVGFGGLYAVATAGAMGPLEALLSTAASGCIFALTAAQPVAILGATGPILAFTAALQQLAMALQLPFLPLYTWTGLWTAALLGGMAVTGACRVTNSWTTFTDEIFSTLVSLIFITQAASNLWQAATTGSPTVWHGMFTMSLAATTFGLTRLLKRARQNQRLFTPAVRNTLANFAPTLGVAASCILAGLVQYTAGLQLDVLKLPSRFVTTAARPWLVPAGSLPLWARTAVALPAACMATLVIFFEHAITHRLLNAPQNGLSKGRQQQGRRDNVSNNNNNKVSSSYSLLDGMHGNAAVMAVLIAAQSLFGLPWLTAATVRSLSHVQALKRTNNGNDTDKGNADVVVMEQRVTNAAIHAVMGALVVLKAPRTWLTNTVPPAALMGLFFYMGLSTLTSGNKLWSRFVHVLGDLFQKVGNIKKTQGQQQSTTVAATSNTTTAVPRHLVRRLTCIQVTCLASLFALTKSKSLGVFFPVVLAFLPPLRNALVSNRVIPAPYMQIMEDE